MIRYVIALLVGIVVGAAAFVAVIYFNPLAARPSLSPLAVSDLDLVTLDFSAVATDSLVYTNDGESRVQPYPAKVLQLWEAPIRHSTAMATVLHGSFDQAVGIGIKFSSESESTSLLNGQAMVDSVWHLYLPGRGSVFVQERENYWGYLREIVVPAYWNSSNSWRGIWNGTVTAGPGALGTARVVGGSGEFAGLQSDGVETLKAQAYSVEQGPVILQGRLAFEIAGPGPTEATLNP